VSTHCHRSLPPSLPARLELRVIAHAASARMINTSAEMGTTATVHDVDRTLRRQRARTVTFAEHASDEKFFVRPRETHDVTDVFRLTCACLFRFVSGREPREGMPHSWRTRAPSLSVSHTASRSDACCNRCQRSAARPGAASACGRAYSSFHSTLRTDREIMNPGHACRRCRRERKKE